MFLLNQQKSYHKIKYYMMYLLYEIKVKNNKDLKNELELLTSKYPQIFKSINQDYVK